MQGQSRVCVGMVLALLSVGSSAEAFWSNSSGGKHYGSASAACKVMIDPGTAFTFSHTEPKPGDPNIAYCFSKPKDGKGDPSYVGVLFQEEDTATTNLSRGNLGERLATECLADGGHSVIFAKPEIEGTNQGGIDIVTMKNGTVYFIDNKALTRSGNVSSVSALTTNFPQNKQAVLDDLASQLAKPDLTEMERVTLSGAKGAIESGAYVKAVTNANLAPDDKITAGVTNKLAQQGIQFIDVYKNQEGEGCRK